MEIKIIDAKREHVNEILKLHLALTDYYCRFEKYYLPSSRQSRLIRKEIRENMKDRKVRVLLALHNGVVVRMMVVKLKKPERYLKGKLMGKISVAFIDEKYRGKGVGRLLFREAIKWFKKHKIKYVRLTVHSKNKIGLSAWTKYGFREFTKDMKLDL